MLTSRYSWTLFFKLEFLLALALLIFAFFAVEESSYERVKRNPDPEEDIISALPDGFALKQTTTCQNPFRDPSRDEARLHSLIPVATRKTYLQTLALWSTIDHDFKFWMTILRSFTYYTVPAVLWVITTYGSHHITYLTYTRLIQIRSVHWMRGSRY